MPKRTQKRKSETGTGPKTPEAPAVEILDFPDFPSSPPWEIPDYVELLMASNEPREWDLSSAIIRYHHLMDGNLAWAHRARGPKMARTAFEAALGLSRVLQKAFRNLHDYHQKGVQRIVREFSDGPMIGQGEKISKMTRRDKNSVEGRILQRIGWTAENYRNIGQHFADEADATTAAPSNLPLQGSGVRQSDEVVWRRLSAAAFQESTKFDALYTRLERARVQIVLVETRRRETATKSHARKPTRNASGGQKS